MLKELHIENIAVIERADIEFSPGFNVISGETASGKSLIIDSINAVTGNRTPRDIVRTGTPNAVVTAVFEAPCAAPWFLENDIEMQDEIIMQRKISSDGRSSCRVNGTPVTAAQMKQLSLYLVDIHGQNDGLRLLDEKSHLGFLDNFGVDVALKDNYRELLSGFSSVIKEIKALSADESEKIRISDRLRAAVEEIEKNHIRNGEYEELTARRDLLRNSEKLKESLDSVYQELSGGDDSVVSKTENALFFSEKACALAPELEEASKNLGEALAMLKSAGEAFSDMRLSLDFSDEEYNALENRIAALNRIFKKYNTDEAGLVAYADECRKKLEEMQYAGEKLEKLKKEFTFKKEECRKAAAALSEDRKRVACILQNRVSEELRDLNMPSVSFQVDFSPVENSYSFDKTGMDTVSFLMSANAGEEPGKISRIASGGELSRIMLALKNVFAEKDPVDTMIFDEIDSGISGIAANRVAEKLWNVSGNKQVMCVSHLPQIAAMADNEYLVTKSEKQGRTYTEITLLDRDGRDREIARMFGGDNISETTIRAAREQLDAAEEYKNGKR